MQYSTAAALDSRSPCCSSCRIREAQDAGLLLGLSDLVSVLGCSCICADHCDLILDRKSMGWLVTCPAVQSFGCTAAALPDWGGQRPCSTCNLGVSDVDVLGYSTGGTEQGCEGRLHDCTMHQVLGGHCGSH
jgi:hypothetical protein